MMQGDVKRKGELFRLESSKLFALRMRLAVERFEIALIAKVVQLETK